jgi:hypothetical protein
VLIADGIELTSVIPLAAFRPMVNAAKAAAVK